MKFWTTPKGEELTFNQFLNRWKDGISHAALSITPIEQTKSQIKFTWVMIVGFILGIIVSVYYIDRLWWVMIVLFGAIGNSFVQLVGLYQKKKMQEYSVSIEDLMKGGVK